MNDAIRPLANGMLGYGCASSCVLPVRSGTVDLLGIGERLYLNNCAGCHGSDARGSKGFPDLSDKDWLWGGTLHEIVESIAYGVRSGNAKAHESAMPAFGKDGLLKPNEIVAVANYVRSLSGLSIRPGVDLPAADAVRQLPAERIGRCRGQGSARQQQICPLQLARAAAGDERVHQHRSGTGHTTGPEAKRGPLARHQHAGHGGQQRQHR